MVALVVPKLLTAGITRDGDRTRENDTLYESVPNRLCNHPLPPEKPSATIQQFWNPSSVKHLATILAESVYLMNTSHVNLVRAIRHSLLWKTGQNKLFCV